MIVDFTVENYRSIKDPVTLSAIAQTKNPDPAKAPGNSASNGRRRPDYHIALAKEIPGRDLQLLPVLGVFGANASGKTNVLAALDECLALMGMPEVGRPRVVPFRLDRNTLGQPSGFNIRVALGETVFAYEITLSRDLIHTESFHYVPKAPAKVRRLFERVWDPLARKHSWRNGPEFGGPHLQLEDALQPAQPYLNLLVNSVKVPLMQPLAKWLSYRWPGLGLGYEGFDHRTAISLGQISDVLQGHASEILSLFDTGISHTSIETARGEDGEAVPIVMVHHGTNDEFPPWPLQEESRGTQCLYATACRMKFSLGSGAPMIVDELGANLHPLITRHIVRSFQNVKSNPLRAQLIFSSHDANLQSTVPLRRDEIWLTAKREDGRTDLYPLTDFRPRNDLAIDRAYLDGRFGAVPVLPSEEDLIAAGAAG